MGSRWDAQRHEDKYTTGIPDLSYSTTVGGWIELKFTATEPAPNKSLRFKHFTPEQRNWLVKHGNRTGLCFLFMRVGPKFILLRHSQLHLVNNPVVPYVVLLRDAYRVWEKQVNWDEFTELISTAG
jgi:hypothetical protein